MTRTPIAAGMAAVALAGGATAETFYHKDGIRFEGKIRLALSDAAVCNVLEENETPEAYERMKANQGRPLHVWRVDLTVRNGSGRELDFLQADSWIRSPWPPCTNWDGPVAGALEPFIVMHWADDLEVLSMPRGMHRDQQERRALYVLAFDGDQPRFGEWDINYTFSKAAGAPAPPGGPARTGPGSGPAGRLPPEIQMDLNLRKAEQAARDGDAATAREAMGRVAAVQAEHGLEPAQGDHYRHAQAWAAAGERQRAVEAAVRYLQAEGRDAEHYAEALDLINRDGSPESASADGNVAAGRMESAGEAQVYAMDRSRAGAPQVFDGMDFVWVPAGKFLMGSTSAEAGDDEQPVTRVRIRKGFWLGKSEVTLAEWQAVMGTGPMLRPDCLRCPVQGVSWHQAQEFINRLNSRAGDGRYRLPTEAEWEYAARAGTSADRYGMLDAIAWSGGGFEALLSDTHPLAGQKAPNAWGLHDMLGNVWEWVQDWYGHYPGGEVTDPRGPASGSERVTRGGSWVDFPWMNSSRAPSRYGLEPEYEGAGRGFRLLRIE